VGRLPSSTRRRSTASRWASGGSPNDGSTRQVLTDRPCRGLITASMTASRWMARTPATSDNGIAGVPMTSSSNPLRRSRRTTTSDAAAAICSDSDSLGSAMSGRPEYNAATCSTSESTNAIRHGELACGPVASASARHRAQSSSSSSRSATRSATAASVAGSAISRLVATSASNKWLSTSRATSAVSVALNPIPGSTSATIWAPTCA